MVWTPDWCRDFDNYTLGEYTLWLMELGFSDIRTVWFEAAGANGAVIGYKA